MDLTRFCTELLEAMDSGVGSIVNVRFHCECPVNMPVVSPSIYRGNLSSAVVLPLHCHFTPHTAEHLIEAVVALLFLCENLCDF